MNPWEYTNHAVVCVGWGEEYINGQIVKYWILKNSWGIRWGLNGYFKMRRGNNNGGIETIVMINYLQTFTNLNTCNRKRCLKYNN